MRIAAWILFLSAAVALAGCDDHRYPRSGKGGSGGPPAPARMDNPMPNADGGPPPPAPPPPPK